MAGLPPIEDCGDLARLAAVPPAPSDLVFRIRIDKLGAELDHERANLNAGILVGAAQRAETILAETRTLEWPVLLGRALRHAGDAHQMVNDVDRAIDRMREASVEAGRARDDAAAAEAMVRVARAAFLRAIELTRRDARRDELEVAAILNDEAVMLKDASQPREARDALNEARRIYEQRLGAGHPRLASVHDALGKVLLRAGDMPAARKEFEAMARRCESG